MRKRKHSTYLLRQSCILTACMIAFWFLSGGIVQADIQRDDPQITSNVPELDTLHESIYILWHDAYPKKNYELIKETLPRLDISVSKLAKSALPEILHNKQTRWNIEIKNLQSDLSELHKATKEENKSIMLKTVEAIHGSFERLVRIIRPVLPELESFHEDLYKVYHYYMPNNDIEKIRTIIPSMKEKIGILKQTKLPQNLTNQQTKFNEAVTGLENYLIEVEKIAKDNNKEKIQAAVDNLHSEYQKIEALFQ